MFRLTVPFAAVAGLLLASACSTTSAPLATAGPPGPKPLLRQHDLLENLVGTFEVAGWTQRDPFGVRLDFVGTGTGRYVVDGLFVELSLRGRLGDADYEAVHLLGFDAASGTYQSMLASSWGGGLEGPAKGGYDVEDVALVLRQSAEAGGPDSRFGEESVWCFEDRETWTLDRYILEWEPRRWSSLRGSRVGIAPSAEPDGSAEAGPVETLEGAAPVLDASQS